MAMSDQQLRTLIVLRLQAAGDQCNRHHRNHVEGQIRGLLAALLGHTPPVLNGYAPHVLTAAEIPFTLTDDGGLEYDDDWLREHGFIIDPINGEVDHPEFGSW